MKYDLKLFLAGIILVTTTTILTLFTIVENASAFVNETEMNKYQKINQKNYDESIEAILNGNFPPQEISENYDELSQDFKFDIYYNEYEIYNSDNPLDLLPEQKKQLQIFKKIKEDTKLFIAEQENNQFLKSKANITCKYNDVGTWAIGYGDNEFLTNKPNVSCITRDVADWILHKQVERRTKKIEASKFYKKWAKQVGKNYLIGIDSKIYQSSPENFLKSKVYALMLENPFKNEKKIKKEWAKWKQEEARRRRNLEWNVMTHSSNVVYSTNYAKHQPQKQQKRKQSILQILEEVGA
jgi:hypothetical protein